ncbi:MAG: primosomal protein N' [Gammaproteobacteria bacterium]|nr:primosomal protein N' [Gammaproteobacteria bacterium]
MTTVFYAEVAIPRPLRQLFDYRIPENMSIHIGKRVKVSFGQRTLVGIVVKIKTFSLVSETDIKSILDCLDEKPTLSTELIELGIWASQYYHYPIGEVLLGMYPTRLRQGKSLNISIHPSSTQKVLKKKYTLNKAQENASKTILNGLGRFHTFLLHGVTGSGKTAVYFDIMEEVLKQKKQILFLIPEIGLSPQTHQRIEERLPGPLFLLHSGLTDKQRLIAWLYSGNGEANIIVGTRSAIFTPFKNLGLIIIDEEHDVSFKQQEGFRYSARDVAIKRAFELNIPIILGSATPSAESYHNALIKKYCLIELTERAGNAHPPLFKLINMPTHKMENGLAKETIQYIKHHLEKKEQVLVFINRRGYAPAWFCQSCYWQADCPRCDSYMVLHKKKRQLVCHHCGHQIAMPTICPKCQSKSLIALGEGTQRIEETLSQLFPNVNLYRIDRDNIKNKHQLEEHLNDIQHQDAALLIGTQMLAKGHHFPNVTLVVMLGLDHGLMSHDFYALERTAQLILQVSGRAGREAKQGTALLQTIQPEHPQLLGLIQHPYGVFLNELLKERQQFDLPPFTFMALFRSEAKQMQKAIDCLEKIQAWLNKIMRKKSPLFMIRLQRPCNVKQDFITCNYSFDHQTDAYYTPC